MSQTFHLNELRKLFSQAKIDGLLVTKLSNLRYLSGFSGTNGIGVVTLSDAFFFTDSRYEQQAAEEVKDFDIRVVKGSLIKALSESHVLDPGSKIGFESHALTYNGFLELKEALPSISWKSCKNIVENLAITKTEDEILLLREAAEMADEIFSEMVEIIRPGMLETEAAAEILYRIKKKGADSSFEPIVASGRRSALPHGQPVKKAISAGDFVVIDFGCKVKGYASDLTRTIVVGTPNDEQKMIYDVVKQAQQTAIDSVRAELRCSDLDALARDIINEAGFGPYFGHALGHGLGLDVHSEPRIGPESETLLQEGSVVTIEPGIYLPELGGVRIEDDIVIRKDRGELLTHSSRDLIEIR